MSTPLLTGLPLLMLLAGCGNEELKTVAESDSEVVSLETVTDTDMEPFIETVENLTSEMVVFDYGFDDMDRGNYEYYGQEVVIDPNYYEENETARGDVIAFKPTPDDRLTLKRIIGLPGEKLKIEAGQVYIDGKILDTFYGHYHRRGLDLKELKKMLEEDEYGFMQSKENIETNVNSAKNTNIEEMTIPENHIYVIGDDWFRTSFKGQLRVEDLEGKILGYES